eukprot:g1463.t1
MHSTNRSGKVRQQRRAFCDAIAGAVSGCISRFVVGPLDVIKIRFQIQIEPIHKTAVHSSHGKYRGVLQALRTIAKEEGLIGLWRGTVPGQLLTIPYTAVQFVTLQQCKTWSKRFGWTEHRTTLVSFISGGIAGAAATLSSYPFDLLRTTLAAQGEPKVYKGMMDAAWKIYAAHGLRGLYSGIHVTLVEIIPYSAIQFAAYDYFHNTLDDFKDLIGITKTKRTALENFICGLGAGIVGKFTTHPLDVIKKRYQVAGLKRSLRYGARVDVQTVKNIYVCFQAVVRREGIAGLWKGSIPNIIKVALLPQCTNNS